MTEISFEEPFLEVQASLPSESGNFEVLRARCFLSQKDEYIFQIGIAGNETALITTTIPPEEVNDGCSIASLFMALFESLPDEAYYSGYSIAKLKEAIILKQVGELNA